MPVTPDTRLPTSGDVWARPWMSWMRTTAPVVVKLHESSAVIRLPGSPCAVTPAATTVTVQLSPWPKSTSGSSVNVVGPPLAVAVCAPLAAHEIVYQAPVTSTGWLNVIVTSAFTATSTAPDAGERVATAGATGPPHVCVGDAVVRGAGTSAAKSAPLLSVSWQPRLARSAAVVLESVGAAAAPSKKLALP